MTQGVFPHLALLLSFSRKGVYGYQLILMVISTECAKRAINTLSSF